MSPHTVELAIIREQHPDAYEAMERRWRRQQHARRLARLLARARARHAALKPIPGRQPGAA
jgi:hypothetical protein